MTCKRRKLFHTRWRTHCTTNPCKRQQQQQFISFLENIHHQDTLLETERAEYHITTNISQKTSVKMASILDLYMVWCNNGRQDCTHCQENDKDVEGLFIKEVRKGWDVGSKLAVDVLGGLALGQHGSGVDGSLSSNLTQFPTQAAPKKKSNGSYALFLIL